MKRQYRAFGFQNVTVCDSKNEFALQLIASSRYEKKGISMVRIFVMLEKLYASKLLWQLASHDMSSTRVKLKGFLYSNDAGRHFISLRIYLQYQTEMAKQEEKITLTSDKEIEMSREFHKASYSFPWNSIYLDVIHLGAFFRFDITRFCGCWNSERTQEAYAEWKKRANIEEWE